MAFLRQYVLSIVTASLLCSVLMGLTAQTKVKELTKLLCCIFLSLTALKPLIGLDLDKWLQESVPYQEEAQSCVAQGEEFARSAQADIIKSKAEAYILDKAAALNVNLETDITICREGTPIPERAVLYGQVSPYVKGQLMEILEKDLGIAKENQVWIG